MKSIPDLKGILKASAARVAQWWSLERFVHDTLMALNAAKVFRDGRDKYFWVHSVDLASPYTEHEMRVHCTLRDQPQKIGVETIAQIMTAIRMDEWDVEIDKQSRTSDIHIPAKVARSLDSPEFFVNRLREIALGTYKEDGPLAPIAWGDKFDLDS